jgi:hypothetical protein
MATAGESPKHAQRILSSPAITITQVDPERVISMADYSNSFSTWENMLTSVAFEKGSFPLV